MFCAPWSILCRYPLYNFISSLFYCPLSGNPSPPTEGNVKSDLTTMLWNVEEMFDKKISLKLHRVILGQKSLLFSEVHVHSFARSCIVVQVCGWSRPIWRRSIKICVKLKMTTRPITKKKKKEQLKSSVNFCQCHLFQKYQQLVA